MKQTNLRYSLNRALTFFFTMFIDRLGQPVLFYPMAQLEERTGIRGGAARETVRAIESFGLISRHLISNTYGITPLGERVLRNIPSAIIEAALTPPTFLQLYAHYKKEERDPNSREVAILLKANNWSHFTSETAATAFVSTLKTIREAELETKRDVVLSNKEKTFTIIISKILQPESVREEFEKLFILFSATP